MQRIRPYAITLLLYILFSFTTQATGWPANYEGVMLQGFYWDSYDDTKWSNLEGQADELSKYFSLIWIPNSARDQAAGGWSMGYTPVYWFTNHNTIFGTEAQLRSMIKTFKEKGTGIIADVVINHRCGRSNWTDFPAEVWNGTVWQLGAEHICNTDEVKNESGQARPTGAADTGDDFNGARDLDHTNITVQNNCKNYCKCLLEDFGYAGFRYDMVKGYAAQYTKIYNEYSQPTFSVGEYWDGSYDALKAWIDGTGKTSAAFDYAFKYAVNDAFSSGDMTRLAWAAAGNPNNMQPAGLIHYFYGQYAVTFIDNHDTYRDGYNTFNGNVLAANAFMLCSPGTPCVFLPHWKENKEAIKKLISVRNAVGVHNNSPVRVLRLQNDCYMAEVTGSKGKLVVKVGPAMVSPDGYSNDDIKTSGNDYCVWTKVSVSNNDSGNEDNYPPTLYLVGHVNGTKWSTSAAIAMTTEENGIYTWEDITIDQSDDKKYGFFSFLTSTGANWDIVNQTDRYGASSTDLLIDEAQSATIVKYPANVSASGALSWATLPGRYNITANLREMTVTLSNSYSDIESIKSSTTIPIEYFNLQGIRVEKPTNGIYIKRQGSTVEKVMWRE